MSDLDETQLRWSPQPGAHSLIFVLWHIARCDDNYLRAHVLGRTEVWQEEEWHLRWGMDAKSTGMLLSDEEAAGLPLPPVEEITGYARRVWEEGGGVRARTGAAGPGADGAPRRPYQLHDRGRARPEPPLRPRQPPPGGDGVHQGTPRRSAAPPPCSHPHPRVRYTSTLVIDRPDAAWRSALLGRRGDVSQDTAPRGAAEHRVAPSWARWACWPSRWGWASRWAGWQCEGWPGARWPTTSRAPPCRCWRPRWPLTCWALYLRALRWRIVLTGVDVSTARLFLVQQAAARGLNNLSPRAHVQRAYPIRVAGPAATGYPAAAWP